MARRGRKPGQWRLLTADKLIKYRADNHISRARLAKVIGANLNSIANWEKGRCAPYLIFQSRLIEVMANPPLVGTALPRLDKLKLRTSEAGESEIRTIGEIVIAWMKANPKAQPGTIVQVVKGVRQALRA